MNKNNTFQLQFCPFKYFIVFSVRAFLNLWAVAPDGLMNIIRVKYLFSYICSLLCAYNRKQSICAYCNSLFWRQKSLSSFGLSWHTLSLPIVYVCDVHWHTMLNAYSYVCEKSLWNTEYPALYQLKPVQKICIEIFQLSMIHIV